MKQTVDELNQQEIPHFHDVDVNVGGRITRGYWSKTGWAPDFTCVIGCGGTPEDAIKNCEEKLLNKENFLSLSDILKLDFYLDKNELYDTDRRDMIRVIGRLVKNLYENTTNQSP